MLSPNELSKIYKIISDENQTFESISHIYEESFKENDKLRIALSLCILIKDNLLNVTQRLISFYIIYLMKKNYNLEIEPFLPLILETIQTTKYISEQNFLFDLLNNQIDYVYCTIKTFLNDNTINSSNKANLIFFQHLYQDYLLNDKFLDKKMNAYIRHILYDRKKSDAINIQNNKNINIEKYINNKEEMSLKYSEPNYMSFCPRLDNNKKLFDKEPIWILPSLNHKFSWESNEK